MAKFPDVTSDDDSDYVPKAPDSNDDSTLSANNTTSDTQGEYSLVSRGFLNYLAKESYKSTQVQ